MLDGMFSSLFFSPASKQSSELCTTLGWMKISVLPHQTMTSRARPLLFLNCAISSINWWASSHLFGPCLMWWPSSRFTYLRSKTPFIGLIACSSGFN